MFSNEPMFSTVLHICALFTMLRIVLGSSTRVGEAAFPLRMMDAVSHWPFHAVCWTLLVIAAGMALLAGDSVRAEPPTPPGGVSGTFNETSETLHWPGIDGATGAMTHTIAFALPQGRGDAQPSLALVYRSGDRHGRSRGELVARPPFDRTRAALQLSEVPRQWPPVRRGSLRIRRSGAHLRVCRARRAIRRALSRERGSRADALLVGDGLPPLPA